MIKKLIIFLALNFGALALGGLFTGSGVSSEWYATLNKAPWTPPGWVFGAAWTTIMVCFSFYMAFLLEVSNDRQTLIKLFTLQWVLNVGWNPAFFYAHQTELAMVIIVSLNVLVGYFLFKFHSILKWKSFLMLPYFIWLLIACSLNGYAMIMN